MGSIHVFSVGRSQSIPQQLSPESQVLRCARMSACRMVAMNMGGAQHHGSNRLNRIPRDHAKS